MPEHLPRLLICLLAAAAVAALVLLAYDGVLIGRVLSSRIRHVAGVVITCAYVLALFCTAAAGLLLSRFGSGSGLRQPRWLVAGLCLCAAALWFAVHGGGFIYSHESMVEKPYLPVS
jgi:hypothetical protein